MKKLCLLLFLFILMSFVAFSRSPKKTSTTFQFGADLMSRYIWRGLDLGGSSPSIQPYAKLTVGTPVHSFSLGTWGAYTFSPTANQEVDMIVSYTYRGIFTATVTDYFFPGLNFGSRDNYFCYTPDSTGHVFEGAIQFNGTEKIPCTFLAAVNFYGNDARRMKKVSDSTYSEDGLQYSTYLELGYKTNLKGFDFNAFVGGTITSPDIDRNETGYYANTKAGITQIGIKVAKGIPITEKFTLPVQASVIANPMQNKMYIIFGISL